MANSAEILDSLKELRKDNREDHKAITERLDEMNGTQRGHTLKIQSIESTQVTHQGLHGIAHEERTKLRDGLQNVSTLSAKKLVALITAASGFAYALLELLRHATASGGTP
jgi:hypothetical protein